MLRFAANLSLLFTERPLLERFAAARAAGFSAVEIQFPYLWGLEAVADALDDQQQELILINIPAGDWANGDRSLCCDPTRQDEFADGLGLAIEWAQQLNVPRLNFLAGVTPSGQDEQRVQQTLESNLKLAAQQCHKAGIELLIEAINTEDLPGFRLHHSDQVVDLIHHLGLTGARLQYDLYHMQIMEGNLISTLSRLSSHIGHIQIADVPGRHEPGSGEINFSNLFKAIEAMGYSGYISLEYNPSGRTETSLEWLQPWITQDRTA
ncbi:TIM barrel protein [Marinobacterium sp. MBR-109]|jgi:hydroxypyruvate isomerase|uniref:hydroxypyruvate isomerase family protein n=1 Tax=Marinobacterium sp. MBR-109 TaxID=3156462 RepID=UPI003396C15B